MTTLRNMIAESAAGAELPVWLHAHRHAEESLGARLARHIRWESRVDKDGRLRGRLAGDDQAVTLRFEPDQEPGTASLQVRVACPENPTCPGPAWDIVASGADLLLALDTGSADDPWCEIHTPDPC